MISKFPGRPTWAEINLDRLGANFRSIKAFCEEGISYMAVIKADAYGHGAVECGKRLESEGVDWFAVATLEEGIELRQGGISRPVLVLGGIWPEQELSFIDFDLTPTLFTLPQAEQLNIAAARVGKTVNVHVKIDTGMNRVGFRHEIAESIACNIAQLKNVRVQGLMTHFAAADQPSENDFTNLQMTRFNAAVKSFLSAGHRPDVVDLANSPAAIVHPLSRSKMVRIGGLLFGITDDVLPKEASRPDLHPVMSLFSRIGMIKTVPKGETIGYGRTFVTERDSTIATIPIGYNDGYDRNLSNKGEVIIHSRKAPVVGRVSMDWITVDVTDIPNAKTGDLVTVIGTEGESCITAEEIARKIDTISYEITCGVAYRVPRIYKTQN